MEIREVTGEERGSGKKDEREEKKGNCALVEVFKSQRLCLCLYLGHVMGMTHVANSVHRGVNWMACSIEVCGNDYCSFYSLHSRSLFELNLFVEDIPIPILIASNRFNYTVNHENVTFYF